MKHLSWFYGLYALFFVALGVAIIFVEKADLHLALSVGLLENLSQKTVSALDFSMKIITEIGANVPFFVALIFLFFHFGKGLTILFAQLFTAIPVQILKKIINAPRPLTFFNENFPLVELHRVEGVSLHSMHSFPSGHTAAAFSLLLCLALFFKRKSLSALMLFLAVLAGYSRIYLSQHFALDVLIGSLLGVLMTSIYFKFNFFENKIWAEKGILYFIKNFKSFKTK